MSTLAPLAILSSVIPLGPALDGWTLLEGSGTRLFRYSVAFEHSFSAPPVVHLGVVGVDAGKEDNLRLRVRAEDVTSAGFTIVTETWLHTRLWAVDVSWLAVGQ